MSMMISLYTKAGISIALAVAQAGFCQAPIYQNFNGSAVVYRDQSGAIFSGGTGGQGYVTQGAYLTQLVPTVCGYDINRNPVYCTPGYVAKFSATGDLVWGTLLSGPLGATVRGLVLDSHGNVWVAGVASTDFPVTANAYQTSPGTTFVSEISPDGSQLLYSTFLVGPSMAPATATLFIDSHDDIYLLGNYAVKFSPSNNTVIYDTSKVPLPEFVNRTTAILDGSGALYVSGSGTVPITSGAYSHSPTGKSNSVYFIGVAPDGASLLFSTVIGGSVGETPSSLARDANGDFYLVGGTGSPDFPITSDAMQKTPGPGFLLKLSADASVLLYSTFIGEGTHGSPSLVGFGPQQLKIGPDQKVYLLGVSMQNDLPLTPDSYLPCYPETGPRWTYSRFAADLRTIEYVTATPALDGVVAPFYFDTTGHVYLDSANPHFRIIDVSKAPNAGPVCLAQSVNRSSSLISAGLFVSIFGPGVGPAQPMSLALDANGRVATQLAGTQVTFDGIPAPILFGAKSRVDVVVPFGVSISGTTIVMVMKDGESVGTLANTLAPSALWLFSQDGSGYGAVAWNQDGTPNSPTNPAKAGDFVTFYGTGAGPMIPVPLDGTIPQSSQSTVPVLAQPIFTVDRQFCTPTYFGDTPGLVEGFVQINCQITPYQVGGTVEFSTGQQGLIYLLYLK